MCTGLKMSYEDFVMENAKFQIKTGYVMNLTQGIPKYLKSKNAKQYKQPKKSNGSKFTGEEFCKILNNPKLIEKQLGIQKNFNGQIIASIGSNHLICIKRAFDGRFKVHDTWDSTNRCIGKFWVIE